MADDEVLRSLQNDLMRQPDKGDMIKAAAGLRKVRVKLPGRGKSGGARAIYLYLPESHIVIFYMFYTKRAKSDLTSAEKAELSKAVEIFKKAIK